MAKELTAMIGIAARCLGLPHRVMAVEHEQLDVHEHAIEKFRGRLGELSASSTASITV